jgi:multidrug resistance efflux pump
MGWRFRRALLIVGPWLLFAGTVAVAAWLLIEREESGRLLGIGETQETAVSALEPGVLSALHVAVGQEVAAGQVLAEVDPSGVEAEIAALEAERATLHAEARAARAESSMEMLEARRRLSLDVEQLEVEQAREKALVVALRAEARELKRERDRLRQLVEQKLARADSLVEIEARLAAVEKDVRERPALVELLGSQLVAARERLRDSPTAADAGALNRALATTNPALPADDGGDVAAQPALRGLEVIDHQIEVLRVRQRGYTLRAPHSGRVMAVWKRVGELVGPELPVLSVANETTRRIAACIREGKDKLPAVGQAATLREHGRNGPSLQGRVVAITPQVAELPPRCWAAFNRPLYGRLATLELDTPANGVPGQAYDVAMVTGNAGGAVAQTTLSPPADPNAAGHAPKPLAVPPALLGTSRFEPSGLAWDPAHHRFIVVSDDTGHDGKGEHEPLLFSMDDAGVVSAEPIRVAGLNQLNDAESIARTRSGAWFVLSSQSQSKKGKRSRARTTFAELEADGAGFRAKTHTSLWEALQGLSDEQWSALGVPKGRSAELDIEGMTANGDELLLGLKSPLADGGRAIVWRLRDPSALAAGKSAAEVGLELWATVTLAVPVGETEVAAGISELLTTPAGTLWIAATPSLESGAEDGGALYRMSLQAPVSSPERVRTFPGLKPEGLGLAPSAGAVTVVFDRGAAAGLWVQVIE